MHAAFVCWNIIGERIKVGCIRIIILKCDIDGNAINFLINIENIVIDFAFTLVEETYIFNNAAFVMVRVFNRNSASGIDNRNFNAFIQEGELLNSISEYFILVYCGFCEN